MTWIKKNMEQSSIDENRINQNERRYTYHCTHTYRFLGEQIWKRSDANTRRLLCPIRKHMWNRQKDRNTKYNSRTTNALIWFKDSVSNRNNVWCNFLRSEKREMEGERGKGKLAQLCGRFILIGLGHNSDELVKRSFVYVTKQSCMVSYHLLTLSLSNLREGI